MTPTARLLRHRALWAGTLACCLLGGCATTPAERFYILGSQSTAVTQTTSSDANVAITALAIPELVDRPQLVLRTGSNRVAVLENQRWAESLKTGIGRVLATELAAQLGTAAVGLPGDRASRKNDVLVSIDIGRFDSALDGMVQVDARWSVRGAADGAAVASAAATGSASVQEPSGASIDTVVAAHDRALARIAVELARSVRQVIGQRR